MGTYITRTDLSNIMPLHQIGLETPKPFNPGMFSKSSLEINVETTATILFQKPVTDE